MRRRAAVLALIVGGLLMLTASASARYKPLPIQDQIKRATSIIDATMIRIDEAGVAHLKVHGTWAGVPVDRIESIGMSCIGGDDMASHGYLLGQRYVFLMEGQTLISSASVYEVRTDEKGGIEARMPRVLRQKVNQRLTTHWQPADTLKAQIARLRSR